MQTTDAACHSTQRGAALAVIMNNKLKLLATGWQRRSADNWSSSVLPCAPVCTIKLSSDLSVTVGVSRRVVRGIWGQLNGDTSSGSRGALSSLKTLRVKLTSRYVPQISRRWQGAGTGGSPAEGEKSIWGLFDVRQFPYLLGLTPSLGGDSLVLLQ